MNVEEALSHKRVEEIERRSALDLSVEEFYKDYAAVSKPVVITGLTEAIFPSGQWSLKHLKVRQRYPENQIGF